MRAAMLSTERLLDGSKSALLVPSISLDRYRETNTNPWCSRDDGFEHGKQVFEAEIARRFICTEGEVFPVLSLQTRQSIQVQAVEIRMVECSRLTDAELIELGYTNRTSYQIEIGNFLGGQRAWFVRLIPLIHSTPHIN